MLSVIFATHNGAETLPMMLDAFTCLEQPDDWEIIAVDNASSDSTGEILSSYQGRLPLQIIHEARRGKNHALNRGLQHVSGELVVLTDDDVIPQSDWLTRLIACAESQPDYDVFGGRILPHWNAAPDPLVVNNAPLGITYALTPEDQETGPIFPGLVWGPNMAVRRRVFEAGHRFDDKVGPSGQNYIMGSETEFTIRIDAAGHHSWFCDQARVQHIIRTHQLAPSWVVQRAFRFGRNQWLQESRQDFTTPCVLGIPRWRFSALLREYARRTTGLISGNPDKVFRAAWEISFLKGFIHEGLKTRRKRL